MRLRNRFQYLPHQLLLTVWCGKILTKLILSQLSNILLVNLNIFQTWITWMVAVLLLFMVLVSVCLTRMKTSWLGLNKNNRNPAVVFFTPQLVPAFVCRPVACNDATISSSEPKSSRQSSR